MKSIKVAAGSLNQTPFDWDRNDAHIRAAIRQAREDGVRLLCLPELAITGYGCEDQFFAPSLRETAMEQLVGLLPETKGLAVAVGLPVYFKHSIYNAVAFMVDGDLAGLVCKRHLAGDGVHYEQRWFQPWPTGVADRIEVDGRSVPIGDLVFDLGGVRVGFEICEDAWVADRPGIDLAELGVDFILNPSASHFAFGKQSVRERFVLEGSRAFGATYLYANLSGNESGRIIYDGGGIVASGGALVDVGPRLSFDEVQLTSVVIDLEKTRLQQARNINTAPRVGEPDPRRLVAHDFALIGYCDQTPTSMRETGCSFSKETAFTRAVCLGLYDYLRKSRSHGFVVSLSGGSDSSAVVALVTIMVDLAIEELGLDLFRERLSYVPELPDTPEAIKQRLLTCVYQGTRNSSETTRSAAETLARAVHATYHQWEIDDAVSLYRGLAEQAIGRELDWETDDIPLQNIQARARAPGVWMLANLRNALLLSTSNRSEAAVGYATMDGDTCGGLCPIAGIDKAFLLHWLAWLEKAGEGAICALPELRAVTAQRPTAELRPLAEAQTDEDDLMPYPVLDLIERAAIRDKQSPSDILRLLGAECPEVERATQIEWIRRFFRLWSGNQWKRERYAPSFHLDDENLDPKTWCRFPILSGGFARALRELS